MKPFAWSLCLAVCAGMLTGCVERRFVVYTDPPGALVYRNGLPIGWSPADDHFVYYGNYHFTIFKDGFETLQVDQEITTPWYEYFPLDLFSEILVPWTILDRREFHYQLEPKRMVNTNELLKDAQNLRNRGMSLGAGSAAAPVPAVPAEVVPAPGVTPSPP